jgi:hypothetical protein
MSNWDGLMNWFLEYLSDHPEHLGADKAVRGWYIAAKKALEARRARAIAETRRR